MGFLSGLVNSEEEKNSHQNNDESNEYIRRAQEEQAEYWNRKADYEEEKHWEEVNLKKEEFQVRLEESEFYYLKVKELYELIEFPDDVIEQKVMDGELDLKVVDKMNFYLSKIDQAVVRKAYEDDWPTLKDNIYYFEELTYLKGKLIERCMSKEC